MRDFDRRVFEAAFEDIIAGSSWQEHDGYYSRYRSRYEAILRRYAFAAPSKPCEVLEIGGGQLALLAQYLWNDRATVADIDDGCFSLLRAHDVETFRYNLATGDPPAGRSYDAAFMSEVIEHIALPGHVTLDRVRRMLKPGGVLVCSTPNLYRLRNVVYLALGRPIFDHFDSPSEHGAGHVIEYSAEHLSWQLSQAGFSAFTVDRCAYPHRAVRRSDRIFALLGAPLQNLPRFREGLVATAVG